MLWLIFIVSVAKLYVASVLNLLKMLTTIDKFFKFQKCIIEMRGDSGGKEPNFYTSPSV